MAINNWRVYAFKDLDPLLDEIKQNTKHLDDMNINYSLNIERVPTPKMPKEQWETVAEKAAWWNRGAINKIKKAEKETNKVIEKNQKLSKQYGDETDRRNAILNRMKHLKGIMKDWLNSDTKNRLAWANMVKESIKEYNELREEANKFIKYIKMPNLVK